MVRTKADVCSTRVSAAKAPRKTGSTSSASASASPAGKPGKDRSGGNTYNPQPTPTWQKGITGFFDQEAASPTGVEDAGSSESTSSSSESNSAGSSESSDPAASSETNDAASSNGTESAESPAVNSGNTSNDDEE